MKKVRREQDDETGYPPDYSDDDIEILEVVGLDEDSPGATALDEEESTVEDRDEIVVDFDDGQLAARRGRGSSASEVPLDDSDRERLLRLHADFENFRRRVEREREAVERHSTAGLVTRLLPVLDNFERAVAASTESGASGDLESFRAGVGLIFRQLLDELRKEGLTAIDSLGQPFDPELHEAVATDTESGLPPHLVVEEMQRGYLLHDRLLRPSLVKVSVERPEPAGGGDEGR